MKVVEHLPHVKISGKSLRRCISTQGRALYLNTTCFAARIDLETIRLEWLIERPADNLTDSYSWQNLPRRIRPTNRVFWISENSRTVAEIASASCGGLRVTARDAMTGTQIWTHVVQALDTFQMEVPSPAWAQTEEIRAFVVDDPKSLVICLYRQSRRAVGSAPVDRTATSTLPGFACQTDIIQLDPLTGFRDSNADTDSIRTRIVQHMAFSDIWNELYCDREVDLGTQHISVLSRPGTVVGSPVRDGLHFAVPWHSKTEVGVVWINNQGVPVRSGMWRQSRVQNTKLHSTSDGLAIQTNHQTLSWLGTTDRPQWAVQAKPYIYHVHCCTASNVFVATDGNGGRLLSLERHSGQQCFNLKPALGGLGNLCEIPGHSILVARLRISRSNTVSPKLLVLSMRDCTYEQDHNCWDVVGTWQHGAICRTGDSGELLAIFDVRSREIQTDR